MRCPEYLQGEAAKLWKKHAKRLQDAGLLTDADEPGFALMCEVWGLLRATNPTTDSKEAIKYIALVKQFQALGKQFGFFAKDRKAANLDVQKTEVDEYGIG
jgi:phage terminase small subunit